jgi:hypothetical protein
MTLKSGCLISVVVFFLLLVVSFPSFLKALKEDDVQCIDDCTYYKTISEGYLLSAMFDMCNMSIGKKYDGYSHTLVLPTVVEVQYNEKYIFVQSRPLLHHNPDTIYQKLYHIMEVGKDEATKFTDFETFHQEKERLCPACVLQTVSEKDWKK